MIAEIIAALVLGATTAITGAVAANSSAEATKEANERNIAYQKEANLQQMAFNSSEAEKQRQWETEMSNTQVQRAMADYQAAGLNPLLAVPGGASFNSGASASASLSAPKQQPVSAFSDVMQSLSSASMSMANLLLVSKLVENKVSAKDLAAVKSSSSSKKALTNLLKKDKTGGFNIL